VPISSRINWGFLTKNFNRPVIGQANERLPQSFTTGISTQPTANVILNFEIYKDVRFSEELRFGAEFKPFNNLALRAGTANNPNRFSAGFGVRVWPLTLDYAFFTHNDLGVTHQMSLSIHIGLKQKVETSEGEPVVVKQEKPSFKQTEASENKFKTNTSPSVKKINLNEATIAELKSLPGIGESLARAIIDYRNKNGPFETSADLLKVSGIGPKTLEKIKDFILIVQLKTNK
ncbi:MAG: helix-hairpin-helix domain-containing protein, partial [bacterium]